MEKKQILIIVCAAIAIIIVVIIFGLMGKEKCKPANLEMWGVYDESEIYNEFINEYKKTAECPVTIIYKKKSFETYEKELVDAFAIDQGPDIWLIHNTWLAKHQEKIKEMPEDLLLLTDFRKIFVEVAEHDLVDSGKIYGLPLYIDTLALFYNKNYFNSAGIASPPETWEDLIEDLDKLTIKNQWGGIERAGATIGTAENINRATDILSLLMLQNGTQMVSEDKKTSTINEGVMLKDETYYPGKDALRFYTDFSNSSKRNYTWNRQMPYSIDAFTDGKSAMMFGYAYHIQTISEKSPYLNYCIATMPQIKEREFDINYANYWAYTVSKKTKSPEEAWKFLLYLTQKEINKRYTQKTGRPTSRRDLIDWQKGDNLNLAVFAVQSLTARSWYQIDSPVIEKIFSEAVESVVLGSARAEKAIETANDQINLLMKP